MRKSKNASKYSKPTKDYKLRVWINGFLLLCSIGLFVFFLLFNLIPLIILSIILIGIAISEFYVDYKKFKEFRKGLNL